MEPLSPGFPNENSYTLRCMIRKDWERPELEPGDLGLGRLKRNESYVEDR